MIITIEGLGEIHSRVSTLLACCNNFKVVVELSSAGFNLVIERTRLIVADRTLFCSKTAKCLPGPDVHTLLDLPISLHLFDLSTTCAAAQ